MGITSKQKNMKIAITGSNGFIGKHLVNELVKNPFFEIIHINRSDNYDITDKKTLKKIPNFDVLIHLAARVFVPSSYENPYDFYNTNVNGTLNMLELCRINNAKIIFMSSYIYGIPEYQPINEQHKINSFNPYSNTKIIGEQLCQGYNMDYNLKTVILRPFNTYGIGQNNNFLIPLILEQAKTGKIELKDPAPKRDMLYIKDLISAIIKSITYDETSFEIFNIGSGKSFSVLEIANIIKNEINQNIQISFNGEVRPTEINDTISDISKISKKLQWSPQYSLIDGIKDLIKNEL